jgi:hypothetical protein
LKSDISIERHGGGSLYRSEVVKSSNIKLDINHLVGSILSFHSWEEKVKNGGVQLDWGAGWDLVVLGPEVEGVGLEEGVGKGIK